MSKRVVIMGAAGRDFHNFNVVFRENPEYEVVAFTAAQIPNIAGRVYPRELAGPRYPRGIPILPEEELPRIVRENDVDLVVLSYSDLLHEEVMHKASRVLALGADFMLLGPKATMLKSHLPVVAVTATRTGSGKSTVTRYVTGLLRRAGRRIAVIRHPMPYGDLRKQVAQRFATLEDLDRYGCTIEEREEYEPHIRAGNKVYAGLDYREVLRLAEEDADVIVWDGGNNDFPFIEPSLLIVVADALRPGQEVGSYPGETNLLMADIVVINKTDTAPSEAVKNIIRNISLLNPKARIMTTGSRIFGEGLEAIRGKRVTVVEDGPTVTHGGLSHGIGLIAAERYGAIVVDPRGAAVGSIRETYLQYPHMGPVIPSIGYSQQQINDLRETLERVECDYIISATPTDLTRLFKTNKPIIHVRYELDDMGQSVIIDELRRLGLI
ncbi:MAG: cyclic 2,3-diphosphoglycerate synthase [Aigarchaeota archaeon]|nr:cyclic 2,3-diphosphoglycerate synthase [Candidatus Pelearchaeum maunauluense]